MASATDPDAIFYSTVYKTFVAGCNLGDSNPEYFADWLM